MDITYTIRKLHLYESIDCSDDDEKKNGKLFNCTTTVTEKELEPSKDAFIQYNAADPNKVIPEGEYLFVQGVLFENDEGFPVVREVKNAAEQLWLEFLWEEKKPADGRIYLRVLDEDHAPDASIPHGFIFQLMRSVNG